MTRSRLVRVLAGVLLAGALALLAVPFVPGSPALAHNQLESTVPRDGEHLDRPPTEVKLVYNAAVSTRYAQVAVSDPDGNLWQRGKPEVSGETVTQRLKSLEDGSYTVAWRVVSADGHPIDGTYEFQVGAGGQSASGSDASAEEQAAGDETPWLWPVVALVGALIVVAAVLGGVVRARESARKRRSAG